MIRNAFLLGLLGLVGCTSTSLRDRLDEPDPNRICESVNLMGVELDAGKFREAFDCLNNMGSLNELEPLILDLETTINPSTGVSYLEDVADMANVALEYQDTSDVLRVFDELVGTGVERIDFQQFDNSRNRLIVNER